MLKFNVRKSNREIKQIYYSNRVLELLASALVSTVSDPVLRGLLYQCLYELKVRKKG